QSRLGALAAKVAGSPFPSTVKLPLGPPQEGQSRLAAPAAKAKSRAMNALTMNTHLPRELCRERPVSCFRMRYRASLSAPQGERRGVLNEDIAVPDHRVRPGGAGSYGILAQRLDSLPSL